ERREAVGPGLLEAADPVVDWLQRRALDAIDALPPVLDDADRAHFPQHAQVLGDLRLPAAEQLHQFADRPRPLRQPFQQPPPPRPGDRVEHVTGGRCPGHGPSIPIWAYVGESQRRARPPVKHRWGLLDSPTWGSP